MLGSILDQHNNVTSSASYCELICLLYFSYRILSIYIDILTTVYATMHLLTIPHPVCQLHCSVRIASIYYRAAKQGTATKQEPCTKVLQKVLAE